jgi:hypothetical protein
MQKWKMTCAIIYTKPGRDVSSIWKESIDPLDPRTQWDGLERMASEGWELVSVSPINCNGYTVSLLYTFKKPMGEE